jgi:hypothetical protein
MQGVENLFLKHAENGFERRVGVGIIDDHLGAGVAVGVIGCDDGNLENEIDLADIEARAGLRDLLQRRRVGKTPISGRRSSAFKSSIGSMRESDT